MKVFNTILLIILLVNLLYLAGLGVFVLIKRHFNKRKEKIHNSNSGKVDE